uniref:DAC domain-containing protein n=1 Tax=Chromera velia CCMP2878 TaxID=1169474 RepID=A0A0K6S641_9ALVE|eukprot:Cvel_14455.t1-p1 / transcript=Cvel_14455.t1 / gene=Cvel_14455 / organism=Chromera_velia_CCMP2878 / gene_product=hypothetical protein / transcript_product=hypothetical protein / location=Cvel_scaffold1029:21451-22218(+) / protein_length=256 / sequence_SO=supercontig / SO=protein_coding / is_pseudo=false
MPTKSQAAPREGNPATSVLPFAGELQNETCLDSAIYFYTLRIASKLACTGTEGKHEGRIYVIGSVDEIMGHADSRKDDVAILLAKHEATNSFVLKEDGSASEEGEAFIRKHLLQDGAFVVSGQNRGRIQACTVMLKTAGNALRQDVQGGTGHKVALNFSQDMRNCVIIKASENSTGKVLVCFRGTKDHYTYPDLGMEVRVQNQTRPPAPTETYLEIKEEKVTKILMRMPPVYNLNTGVQQEQVVEALSALQKKVRK